MLPVWPPTLEIVQDVQMCQKLTHVKNKRVECGHPLLFCRWSRSASITAERTWPWLEQTSGEPSSNVKVTCCHVTKQPRSNNILTRHQNSCWHKRANSCCKNIRIDTCTAVSRDCSQSSQLLSLTSHLPGSTWRSSGASCASSTITRRSRRASASGRTPATSCRRPWTAPSSSTPKRRRRRAPHWHRVHAEDVAVNSVYNTHLCTRQLSVKRKGGSCTWVWICRCSTGPWH